MTQISPEFLLYAKKCARCSKYKKKWDIALLHAQAQKQQKWKKKLQFNIG